MLLSHESTSSSDLACLPQSEVEDVADYEALDIADAVPLQWLPPYEGAGGGHAVSAAAPVPSRAASMRSGSPTTTAVSETGSGTGTGSRGLRQVLPLPRGAGRWAELSVACWMLMARSEESCCMLPR